MVQSLRDSTATPLGASYLQMARGFESASSTMRAPRVASALRQRACRKHWNHHSSERQRVLLTDCPGIHQRTRTFSEMKNERFHSARRMIHKNDINQRKSTRTCVMTRLTRAREGEVNSVDPSMSAIVLHMIDTLKSRCEVFNLYTHAISEGEMRDDFSVLSSQAHPLYSSTA